MSWCMFTDLTLQPSKIPKCKNLGSNRKIFFSHKSSFLFHKHISLYCALLLISVDKIYIYFFKLTEHLKRFPVSFSAEIPFRYLLYFLTPSETMSSHTHRHEPQCPPVTHSLINGFGLFFCPQASVTPICCCDCAATVIDFLFYFMPSAFWPFFTKVSKKGTGYLYLSKYYIKVGNSKNWYWDHSIFSWVQFNHNQINTAMPCVRHAFDIAHTNNVLLDSKVPYRVQMNGD